MKKRNIYYTIGTVGLALNLLLSVILSLAVDPYLAFIFNAFYPVWIIMLVVGWRKAQPRR